MAYQNNRQANAGGGMLPQKTPRYEEFKGLINTKDIVSRATAACGSKELGLQFMASMLDLYEGNNSLQKCDPQKVVMECLKAASLHLPLAKSLGYAYVVPYGNTPTFIVGYRGLVQLAQRSGMYKSINADCIYEGEEITFNRLSGTLSISGTPTSDKAVGYFGYFQLLNGFEKTFYMTVEQVQEYGRKYSKAYSDGPWQTEFDAMAKKTVVRQLLKWGPASTEMQQAELADIRSAEAAAKADIQANANRGGYVDVQGASYVETDNSSPEDPGAENGANSGAAGAADGAPEYSGPEF